MVTKQPPIFDLDDEPPYVSLMVYAMSGAGKTVFAASDDDVLIMSTEKKGTLSAARSKMTGKNVKFIKGYDWNTCIQTRDWLTEYCEKHGKGPANWFVVDTVSNLQRVHMLHQLDVTAKKFASRGKSPTVPEQQDYLVNQHELIRYIETLNDLPMNILYLAHAELLEDEEGETYIQPKIHGKEGEISKTVCAQMTSYGCLKVVTEERQNPQTKKKQLVVNRDIWWVDKGSMRAKDRTGVLAPKTRNLTLKEIRRRVETGSKTPDAVQENNESEKG